LSQVNTKSILGDATPPENKKRIKTATIHPLSFSPKSEGKEFEISFLKRNKFTNITPKHFI
jgi:hypothetical protein